ncbi:hypothetical protein, partial [Coleofasciculus sp.]|uniref:hypothetical protein n=1 Tax=Coleofasciculus sp. TaxID=3100458 RepID=UPI003A3E488B
NSAMGIFPVTRLRDFPSTDEIQLSSKLFGSTESRKPLSKPLSCKERGFELSSFRSQKNEASFYFLK